MSIWVTGSLEVRNSSDELVFQVGDSTNNAPTSFKSAQVTGSFEVVSDPVYAHNVLSASWDFVNEGPRLSVGTGSPINVALGVGGDLGLSDTVSDTRLTVVGTNSYLNVGSDNSNRGFMLWENGSKRLRFGTKESGNNYFSSLIVKTGSLDVDNNLSIGGNTSTDGTFHARDNISTDGTLQLGVGRILAPDGGTSITIDNDDNVGVIGSLQVGGNVIKASDGGSTITMDTDDNVTIAGRLSVGQGITSNSAVRVSSTDSDLNNDPWIKIASSKGTLEVQDTMFASFLVTFEGGQYAASWAGDFAYIVNVRFTHNSASPYYYSEGTNVTVEPLNSSELGGFDPAQDVAITFDNTTVEVWAKNQTRYKECFVSYLGGTNSPDGGKHDTGFEISTSQSWSASITSLGQEVYGQYVDKVFENAHVEGNLNVTGSLEFLGASEINSTAGLTINSTGTTLDGANVTVSDDLVVNGGNVFINKTTTSAEADIRLRTYYTDNISAGDNVGAVSFWGSENGTDWQQLAYILAEADEDFAHGSNFGSRIKFGTAPNGGTLTHQVEIDNAGNLITDGSVLVSGSLKLDSLIEDSAGNTVITLPGDGNTVVEGTIVANGDTIEDSGNNIVMQFDGSGNISIGGEILDSNSNTMISLGDDMSVGRPGAGSVSIGVSSDAADAKMVVNSAAAGNNRGVNIFRAPASTFNAGLRALVEDSSVGFAFGARGESGTTGKWQAVYNAMRVAGATNLAAEIVEYPTSIVGASFDTDYWSTNSTSIIDPSTESKNTGNSMTLWDRVVKSVTAVSSAVTNIEMTKDIPCGPTYRIRVAAGTAQGDPGEATDVTKLQYSTDGGSNWSDTGNEIVPTTAMATDTNGELFSWNVDTSAISTNADGIRFRLYYDPSSAGVDIMYYGPISVRENTASFTYPLVVTSRYPLNGGTQEGRTEGSNYYIKFCTPGSTDNLGYIYSSYLTQETITYSTFTGAHEGYIEDGQTIDDFDILVYDSISPMGSEAIYNCRSSSSAMQKNVIGINGGSIGEGAMAGEISVVSLGNFLVKVCSQGGNLEIGDLICTSDVKGAGMKQSDDIIRAQTVARASENVDWSQETNTTKIIHCTVHCG